MDISEGKINEAIKVDPDRIFNKMITPTSNKMHNLYLPTVKLNNTA